MIRKSFKKARKIDDENENNKILSSDLNKNIEIIQSIYADCSDIIYRPFLVNEGDKAVLIYIDGLADTQVLEEHVMAPLMKDGKLQTNIDNLQYDLIKNKIPVK